MGDILVYLLKANVVLAFFALAYYGLLRRLTFFGLNRAYLLLALLFAAAYPALPVPTLLPAEIALPTIPTAISHPVPLRGADFSPAGAGTAWLVVIVANVYAAGAGLLLLRLLSLLLSLALVRRRARPAVVLGQPVRVVAGAGGPFSFGGTIYLSAAALADPTSLAPALRHEQAHVRQLHTIDVLLAQMATALAWANPAAWLLRRAVLDNLEYLADRAALQTGLDRRAYQYSLLRQRPGGVPAPALAFHFSFLTLKNRITMLNQPASTTRQLGRYLLAAPLLMALALGYSAAQAQVAPTLAPVHKALSKNFVYFVDGKRVSAAEANGLDQTSFLSMDVVESAADLQLLGVPTTDGAGLITTKANANSPAVLAFNKRFPVKPGTAAQNAGLAAASAYMAKTYPGAKLESVGIVMDQADHYRATFMQGGQRMQLLFNGQGEPIKE